MQLRRNFLKQKMKFVLDEMESQGIDLWLTFTREGNEDPLAEDLALNGLTWRSAGLIWSNGNREAVVGSYEAETVRQRSFYEGVYAYGKEGAAPLLMKLLARHKPKKIAVNTSYDFGIADGLSVGMANYMRRALSDTGSKLVSSEDLVVAMRAKMVRGEIDLIRKSISFCEKIYKVTEQECITVGRTDKEIHDFMIARAREMGLLTAWPEDHCPSVLVGNREPGHVGYHNVVIKKGSFVKLDFGVSYEGYCSDIQHCYFVGGAPSAAAKRIFETARDANDECLKELKPGVPGYVIDRVARDIVTSRGYPEFMHATGHALGRSTHEIGPLLGPVWPWRYGKSSKKVVQENMVFTIEPTVSGPVGTCNLEQDVLVTGNGYEPLSHPQLSLITIDR